MSNSQQSLVTFLKQFTAFLICAIMGYVGFVWLAGEAIPSRFIPNIQYQRAPQGYLYTRMEEAKHISDLDIVVIGSSHAYRQFDPRVFAKAGYKLFVIGSNAQTPIQSQLFVRRYLEKLNPKLVILECYPATFEIDGVESALDVVSYDRNDLGSLEMALSENNIKLYNTLTFAMYKDFLRHQMKVEDELADEKDNYISGGYVERDLEFARSKSFDSSGWAIQKKQLIVFKALIDELKQKKINYLLVQTPVSKSFYNSRTNNKDFDNTMESLGEYYNFNKTMVLNDSLDFFDVDHLNQTGVRKFSTRIIEKLKQRINSIP